MRRLIRLALSLATIGGLVTMASPVALAAPGDVTSTAITLPSAVAGLTGSAVVSARDGGMYYAFATGNDYKVFKTKPNGTQDTSFGVNGILDLVTGISGTKRLILTSDVNGKWWATVSHSNGSILFGGNATGAATVTKTFSLADLRVDCAAAYPTINASSWNPNNLRALPRRGGGVWLNPSCTPVNGSSTTIVADNMWIAAAYTAAGTRDTTVPVVGLHNNFSSSSPCYSTALVSDPTGGASTPELYAVRTEFTQPNNATCTGNTSTLTASAITGYSIVSIMSNGTATSKSFASAGDATDGLLASRIDPGGRLVLFNSNVSDPSTMTVRRVKTDGTLDTTVGTAGVLTVSVGAAPAGQSSVRATSVGIITTPTKVYFAVLLSDNTNNTSQCGSTTPFTWGYRMAVVSPTDGLLSSFGTNGVSSRTFVTAPENTICTNAISGGGSVDTDGQLRLIRFSGGSTYLDIWAAPTGANGGGEGGTGSGGPTTDTGGAASKGDGLQVLTPVSAVDATVYAKLPATIGLNSAIQVLTDRQAKKWALVTRTPGTCLTLTTSILATSTGTCTVRVVLKETGDLQKTLTTKVVQIPATAVGTGITASEPVQFAIVGWKLSATAKTQLAKIAETAKTSSRIVIVGHSALLRDTAAFNQQVSIRRAAAVKTYLQKLGVKTAVNVVGLGSRAPLTTKKTESAQAKNRRVVVYFYP